MCDKKKKEYCNAEAEHLDISALENRHAGALEEWKELQKKAMK